MNYDWDFGVLRDPEYQAALLRGLWLTIRLTFWCVVVGTPLGIALGAMTLPESLRSDESWSWSSRPIHGLRRTIRRGTAFLAVAFIDVVRAVPLLLFILTAYYLLPEVLKSPIGSVWRALRLGDPKSITGFQCAAAAMAVNLAAFVGDLVRGAVGGVPSSHVVAARALGMNPRVAWWRIVLPDILRQILPGLTLLYITMLKLSTLASAVGVYELLHSADGIIQRTYKPLELYLAVSVLFIVAVVPLSILARKLERTKFFLRRSQS